MWEIFSPLCVDIVIHFRNIQRIRKHGVCAVANRHRINADIGHRVERADKPSVGAVAPEAVISSVIMFLHGGKKQNKTAQRQPAGQQPLQSELPFDDSC